MRGLFWILALFALAVGISLAMHVNDGYVLLEMPPYRAEISLNLAILLVLLAFAVLYAFLRAAAAAFGLAALGPVLFLGANETQSAAMLTDHA